MSNKKIVYPKLPKKFKEKWLIALRGGKYKQGIGCLCKNGAYCCIGIAGKVQGLSDDFLHAKGMFSSDWDFSNFNRIKRLIPNALLGTVYSNRLLNTLVDMNDGTGRFQGKRQSLKQIANWIEKNL